MSEVCKFSKPHMNEPLFISYTSCVQYKQCQMSKYHISITVSDNCFIIKGKVGSVRNIFQDHPPKNQPVVTLYLKDLLLLDRFSPIQFLYIVCQFIMVRNPMAYKKFMN